MQEQIDESRIILLNGLHDLGYRFSQVISYSFLDRSVQRHTQEKLDGIISDFVLLPGGDGLAEDKYCAVYIKRKRGFE